MILEKLYSLLETEETRFKSSMSGITNLRNDIELFQTGVVIDRKDNLDSIQLIKDLEAYKSYRSTVEKITVGNLSVDLPKLYEESLSDKFIDYISKMDKLEYRRNSDIEDVRAKLKEKQKQLKSEMEMAKKRAKETVEPLAEKHERYIEKYKGRIEEIMNIYYIPQQEIVNLEAIDLTGFNDLLDASMDIAEDTVGTGTILDKLVSILYLPLVLDSANDEIKLITSIVHLVALGLLAFALRPYAFGIIGSLYILSFLARIYKVKIRREMLQVAHNLTEPIDLSDFIDLNEEYLTAKKTYEDSLKLNCDKEIEEINQYYDELVEEHKKSDPQIELDEAQKIYNENIATFSERMKEARKDFDDSVKTMSINLDNIEKVLYDKLKYLASNFKSLAQYWDEPSNWKELSQEEKDKIFDNESQYMNGVYPYPYICTKYRLGTLKYEDSVLNEYAVELPLENVIFSFKGEKERMEQSAYMKLFLVNTLCNIKERGVKISIYDDERMGSDLGEFLQVGIEEELISNNQAPVQEGIKAISMEMQSRVSRIHGNTDIQRYNRQMYDEGRSLLDYKLFIFPSVKAEDITDAKFRTALKICATYGILVYALIDESILDKDESQDDVINAFKDLTRNLAHSPEAGTYVSSVSGKVISDKSLPENATQLKYLPDLGTKCMNTIQKCISNKSRNKVTFLHKDLVEYSIPRDKVWTYSTRDGIELNPGYREGDKSRFEPLVLGDDTVHALMAGATGSGKSATINQIIGNMLLKYSPIELDLRLIDFKDAEFHMYARPRPIPHSRIITGTKDGLYALSMFKAVHDELVNRNKEFQVFGLNKIVDYNDLVDKRDKELKKRGMYYDQMEVGYTPEKLPYRYFADEPDKRYPMQQYIMPRSLLIVDEFTVMYNEVESKYLNKIESEIMAIATLGRNAGCHLWFTTQNFSGTMSPAVMEQFKLRMALYLSSNTSSTLLGSPIASTIVSKGWLYVNQSGTENVHAIKLYKVPFCPPSWINGPEGYIEQYCYAKLKEGGFLDRKAIYYSDSTVHKLKELVDFYDTNENSRKYPDLFLLGPNATYTDTRNPYSINLKSDIGENLLIQSTEHVRRMELLRIIIENLNRHNVNHLMITGDARTTEEFKDYSSTMGLPIILKRDGDEVVKLIRGIFDKVNEDIDKAKEKSTYIIIDNIDMIKNLGRELDARVTGRNRDAFEGILNASDENRVHFIVLCVNAGQVIPTSYIPKFSHIITTKSTYKNMSRLNSDFSDVLSKLEEGFAYYVNVLQDAPVRIKVYESDVVTNDDEDPVL